MEALRSGFTEVWVPASVVSIVQFADEVRSIAGSGIDVVGLPGRPLPAHLREFDRIVSWYGAGRPEFVEAVRELPFEFHAALPTSDSLLHASDFFLSQVGASLGGRPVIKAESAPMAAAVIHPFSGGRKKNWPLAGFQEVARALGDVCWLAGPEEVLDGSVHFDSLADVARCIAGAELYIGNDSGITHLAAAVGVRVTAIFGPSEPRVWAPRGDNVCVLLDPTPAEVLRVC